jgi:hypothetical protein
MMVVLQELQDKTVTEAVLTQFANPIDLDRFCSSSPQKETGIGID